jgi:phospholipid/cholesterol/gamma-HCH transport system substrate-binding protein
VAPPIVRGAQLARRRVGGVIFLLVLAGLVALTVALYQKAFAPVVSVTLLADRAGNQLSQGADVKARGVIVGRVESIAASPDGARLQLALDPGKVELLPADVRAQLLPKTLFGEKFVALLVDDGSSAPPLADGDVIRQDRSQTAIETAQALDNALPLLRTLRPEQLSLTLNAVSSALRDRGNRIGSNLVLARDYLAQFNPELPTLDEDFGGLADFNDNLTATADDLVQVLSDLGFLNRSLVDTETELDTFLRDSIGVTELSEDFLAENEQRFTALAAESVANLDLYEKYAPEYACLADGLVRSREIISDTFGVLQPGLHITLEFTENNGPYEPGDEPEHLDRAGPTCRGLIGPPEVPFPEYRDGADGYRDGQEVDPQTGKRSGSPPDGPDGDRTYPDDDTRTGASATPFSPASYDRAAVGVTVAPVLGVTPDEVPDVAVLLFGPVARDIVVRLS